MIIKTIPADALFDVLGRDGEHWIRGQYEKKNGATRYCLHGAIRACCPQSGDAMIIEQVASDLGWGTSWNDNTTWDDVLSRIEADIIVTDEDLQDTFGPQWKEFVALVRRVAVLTASEIKLLSDTPKSLDAIYCMALSLDKANRWDSARSAILETVKHYRFKNIERVTWALVLRDQLDQETYDTMRQDWCETIGPIHPDDKA